MTATLIVSVSDLTDNALRDCARFGSELDSRLVPASWLLPPRPKSGPHDAGAPLIGWLRERLRVGDTLVMHGFDHAVPPLARPRIGRRAEFAGLPSHEAALRLIAASRAMDELGLHSDVFAPPRWLSSPGTLVALRKRGFRVCADSVGVRTLVGSDPHGELVRSRVLSFVNPTGVPLVENWNELRPELSTEFRAQLRLQLRAQLRSSQPRAQGRAQRAPETALVRAVARAARRGGLVRVAATAGELTQPETREAILDAIDAALNAGARPASYRAPLPATRLAA
ncbi:MAG TPA: DUF2334 domain-containing protein [Pseudonocardia sp.]|nr:DUF2334 domain-containing protein [Pseudonocardia sp.]